MISLKATMILYLKRFGFFFVCVFKICFIFRAILDSHQNWMENTDNSFIPPPLPVSTQLTASPTISISSSEWYICQQLMSATEPTLIHIYHPKIHSSYLELNLSVAHTMLLGKSVTCLHHYSIIQNKLS